MNWRTWCCVMLVMVVVATTSVETCQVCQHSKRKDFMARSEFSMEQAVEDVECGKDEDGNTTDCHPETDIPTGTPTESEKMFEDVTSGEDLLPKSNECGLRSRKSYRVYFGEDAPLSAYPWLALIGYKNLSNPSWLCGGTLINNRYVITAAHCVHVEYTRKSRVGKLVKIRLGEHNIATDPDCLEASVASVPCAPSPQEFNPEEVIVHEAYNSLFNHNDIALIRLERSVTFSRSVRPVCLPPAGLDVKEFLGSREAVVAGWGVTEDKKRSKVLQRAPIPYADKDKCEKMYFMSLIESQICFGGRGKVDSCYGDSGGPVMQAENGTSRYTLLAIVSFGKNVCGIPGTPAVYTNVAYYRDWIVENLKP